MKTKVRPAVVGAFVIGAIVFAIIALLAFGRVSFFSKPQRFVVYFDESIHGLDLGSPVKVRGVRIGRVVDLNVRYDAATNRSLVGVVCEMNRNLITDSQGKLIDVSDREELQKLVDRGLRARLDLLGLATGLLFVQLDFFDPQDYPVQDLPFQPKYVVVPYIPSTIAEFQANLTEILNDVKKFDFEGVSAQLKGLLTDTRKQVDGLDLKGAVSQWQRTGAKIEALAGSPQVEQTFTNLNAAIADLRRVLADIDAQVGPSGKELAATLTEARKALESFNATATAAHRFIAAQGGLGDEAAQTMEQLRSAAEAVQRLADFLERNPQALISGKKR
jgi:paraquat-inducible protein B